MSFMKAGCEKNQTPDLISSVSEYLPSFWDFLKRNRCCHNAHSTLHHLHQLWKDASAWLLTLQNKILVDVKLRLTTDISSERGKSSQRRIDKEAWQISTASVASWIIPGVSSQWERREELKLYSELLSGVWRTSLYLWDSTCRGLAF